MGFPTDFCLNPVEIIMTSEKATAVLRESSALGLHCTSPCTVLSYFFFRADYIIEDKLVNNIFNGVPTGRKYCAMLN